MKTLSVLAGLLILGSLGSLFLRPSSSLPSVEPVVLPPAPIAQPLTPNDPLVGVWRYMRDDEIKSRTLDFFADGKMLITAPDKDSTIVRAKSTEKASWERIGGNRIRVDKSSFLGSSTVIFEISSLTANKLALSLDGETIEWERD